MFCLQSRFTLCLVVVALFAPVHMYGDDFEFRQFNDNSFFSYYARALMHSTERFYHDDDDITKRFEEAGTATNESRVTEFGFAYSMYLFSLSDNFGLRFEPELSYISSSGEGQFGFSLPLRLQYGAMSSSSSYARYGVGLVLGYGSLVIPEFHEGEVYKVPTGLNYKLMFTGMQLGSTVISLELGYSSYYMAGNMVNEMRTGYDVSQMMLGISLCGYDL